MSRSRRNFLVRSASLAAGAVGLGQSTLPAFGTAAADVPIVDTHQHLWDLNRLVLPWLDPNNADLEPLRHNFLMPEYEQHTQGLNIVKTLYMEVNVRQDQQQAEADFVLGLCEQDDNSMVGAIIGGYPHDPGFADYITPLAKNSAVKGVRTVLHDPDRPPGLCLRPEFVDNIRRLGDLGVNFDLCMRPDEVRDGAELAQKCPNTRFIVDHCGNMGVNNQDKSVRRKWQDGIRAAGDQENVFVKISGIVASATRGEWVAADLAPNINFCLDTFGDDRCVFGGDWPVCLLGASFREWVTALKEIVKDRSPEFQKKLFHDNAHHVYRIG